MDTSDSMGQFLAYHRRMLRLMIAAALVAAAGIFIATRPDFSWTGGFLAGAAAQLFKFAVVDVAIIKKIAATREKAATVQLKASVASLALFAAAVVVVYCFGLNVWAMAAGIFLPRILLILDTYLRPNPFAVPAEETGDA